MKHTPGPWKAAYYLKSSDCYEIVGKDNRVVGLFRGCCNEENDLPLIVAAPEILKALELAYRFYVLQDDIQFKITHNAIRILIENALAKAEGRITE